MTDWLAKCSEVDFGATMFTECVGAKATLAAAKIAEDAAYSAAYIQSAVTAIAAILALVAGVLAYRASMSQLRDAEKVRKDLATSFAHRLYFALDVLKSASVIPIHGVDERVFVRTESKPLPREMDVETWQYQAQLGPETVELLIGLGEYLAILNKEIEDAETKYGLSGPGPHFMDIEKDVHEHLRELAGMLDARCTEIQALLSTQYGIAKTSASEDRRRAKLLTMQRMLNTIKRINTVSEQEGNR